MFHLPFHLRLRSPRRPKLRYRNGLSKFLTPAELTTVQYDAMKRMVDRNKVSVPGQPETAMFGLELAGAVKELVDAATSKEDIVAKEEVT